MINGFHAAKSGMRSFQTSLDVTANNIANVNTEGYQTRNVNFADLVYTKAQGTDLAVGNGSKALSISLTGQSGSYGAGDSLSAVISGEGYYAVQNTQEGAENARLYTRNSAFELAADGDQIYLAIQSGEYVLDANGARIQVTDGDLPAAFAQVALFTFPNDAGLDALGGGLFAANENSGEPVAEEGAEVVQGISEGSDVNLAMEMAHLITSQRGFQASARMLQTIDEVEQTVNALRV